MTCTVWPMGAAWLCLHLWEHVRFGGDADFLRDRAYPVMKEAAIFLLDYMTIDGEGRRITGPSVSPENRFMLPDGAVGSLCMGPSMDSQIAHALLQACLEAGRLLGEDTRFLDELEAAIRNIPAPQIGRHGGIMEWLEDYEEADPGHRHISQLFALYPGSRSTRFIRRSWPKPPRGRLSGGLRMGRTYRLEPGLDHQLLCAAIERNGSVRAFASIACLFDIPEYARLPSAFSNRRKFWGNCRRWRDAAAVACRRAEAAAGAPVWMEQRRCERLRARGGWVVDMRWEDGELSEAKVCASRAGRCAVWSRTPLVPVPVEGSGTNEERLDDPSGSYRLSFLMKEGESCILRRDFGKPGGDPSMQTVPI